MVDFPPSGGGTFQAAGDGMSPSLEVGRPRAMPVGLEPQEGDGEGWRSFG